METYRLVLLIALAFVSLLLFQAWEHDYGNIPAASTPQTVTQQTDNKGASDIPQAANNDHASVTTSPVVVQKLESAERVHVDTDLYNIVIDTAGGDIRQAKLKHYSVSVKQPDMKFELLNDDPAHLFITQTGILGKNAPTHNKARYQVNKTSYTMQGGSDTLKVVLHWQGQDGVSIDKIYTFHRGSYVIDLDYQINNGSAGVWAGRMYRQFKRIEVEHHGGYQVRSFTGAVVSNPEKPYTKLSFSDMREKNLNETIKGGWTAMVQHYFMAAWLTDAKETSQVYTKESDNNNFIIGMIAPRLSVEPGQNASMHSRFFLGPKLQDLLADIAPNLELSVDYGLLTIIAKPIFWLMERIHGVVNNWGWSIILLTLMIKLVFYKLSETSYKSMANMRRLQPRLAKMKERFGDDKQAMQKGMMELYKKEKINPLGGCFPILIQIPVFISLYWVLIESVELRQADFIFWLKDLSSQDPYYVLPVLNGITMFLQQKLNPAPMDPMQAKIMMMLPIVFTVFFLFFPAGLVLYWVTNNVLSMAQQWVITKRIEAGNTA